MRGKYFHVFLPVINTESKRQKPNVSDTFFFFFYILFKLARVKSLKFSTNNNIWIFYLYKGIESKRKKIMNEWYISQKHSLVGGFGGGVEVDTKLLLRYAAAIWFTLIKLNKLVFIIQDTTKNC